MAGKIPFSSYHSRDRRTLGENSTYRHFESGHLKFGGTDVPGVRSLPEKRRVVGASAIPREASH
jgi:hypothetical protein